MDDGKTLLPGLRQLLWIAAGVVVLTALVLAASWLFSPSPPPEQGATGTGHLQEEQVRKETFTPESAPGRPETARPIQPQVAQEPPPEPAPPVAAPVERPPAPSPEQKPAPESAQAAGPPGGTAAAGDVADATGAFGVQVGAFSTREKAADVQRRLGAGGFKASVSKKGGLFKVTVTGYPTRGDAEKGVAALKRAGFPSAFVVPME